MKNVTIIEFPSNLGLIEPSPGHEPGVKKLPAWLKKYKFHEHIQPNEIFTLDPPSYSMNVDKVSGVRNAEAIIQYAQEQSRLLSKILATKNFPLVIGGDCSILIGNTLALKKAGDYGLFFLDGHTDFITPDQSGTAGAAGMDLAIVSGHGHAKLTDIDGQKPYIKEAHAYCVGNREYNEAYELPIKGSSIRYLDLLSLRKTGIENCVIDFLKMIHSKGLDGFWIHVDVDVLNDEIMPAVDSRTPGGLTYNEFDMILKLLLADTKAAGMEITILDPELDPGGKYTGAFVDHFCNIINDAKEKWNK
ncbi:MAG: arginase family protein [Ferruginibacter sp.]